MKFECPHCGQHLAAEGEMAGRQVVCPNCKHAMAVPARRQDAAIRKGGWTRALALVFILIMVVGAITGWAVLRHKSLRKPAALLAGKAKAEVNFEKQIVPVLNEYCFSCHGNGKHKGDLALDVYKSEEEILKDRKRWELVMHHLRTHEMPPDNKPQPSDAQRDLVIGWIDSHIFKIDCNNPDPGRVTLRRLNRAEYNNTIHDLVGVDFDPAEDFPADDSGYGFDNIGDVLTLPPTLLEKYLVAAQKILNSAIVNPAAVKTQKRAFSIDTLEIGYNGKRMGNGWVSLNSTEEDDVAIHLVSPLDSQYLVRVRAYGVSETNVPLKISFRVDNKENKMVEVTAAKDAPQFYEARVSVPKGRHRISAVVPRLKNKVDEKQPLRQKASVFVDRFELEGPLNFQNMPLPETHARIFSVKPTPETKVSVARTVIERFARRAYRRPLQESELNRLMILFSMADKDGESFEKSVQVALEAVLVSPHFLFRGELQPDPNNPNSIYPIDEYALASRLSYFIWSSMPDEALFALAEKKALRKNMEAEVKRMLKDPKARALVDNFAGQWLQIRNLKMVTPDYFQFPEFDESLRTAMQKETELFFEAILREDRSLFDFLEADYTFVNERLARHYGMTGVTGDEFRKVSLKGTPRRGLLTQASVLTLTSNPTRTSPVKRGKWVLENILGTPPPPAPPDVPELSEAKEKVLSGTLRQRMEQHRENPVCASCHARMDPIGFGLENFNGVGGWRKIDGKFEIDPAGKLVSGESFRGPEELTRILAGRRKDEFIHCVSEKILTYALGRGMEYYDKCALEEMARDLNRANYRFSSLVLAVVKSTPFQKRRGESSGDTKTFTLR